MREGPSIADQMIEHGPYQPHQAVAWWDTAALNELRDELTAARALRDLLGQVEVSALYTLGPILQIRHTCPHWAAHVDRPLSLAELVQRASEHAEVCR